MEKEYIIGFIILLVVIWIFYPYFERFDATGTEFVPVGGDRYGLRGELLRRSSIENWYIRPDRRIRLSHSGGEMWESNYDPSVQGIKDCHKVPCPSNGFDSMDVCWKCGDSCPKKMVIPDVHPHSKN
jgi:hypothetical protein